MKQRDGQVVLAEPYAATRLTTAGPRPTRRLRRRSGALRPGARGTADSSDRFTVQFVESKDELTEESKAALEAIFAEIAKRPVPDVLVVGHTDSVGSDQYNDAVAPARRCHTRRPDKSGIAPENIQAVGRGNGVVGQLGRRGGATQPAGK